MGELVKRKHDNKSIWRGPARVGIKRAFSYRKC